MTGLQARLDLPERDVRVELQVEPGETCALIGPNGAGKSSVLAAVVGQLPAPGSRIELDDRVLVGDGSPVPVHRRRLGWLAQRSLLMEHLSVADNVAFGLVATGTPRRAARERAHAELEAVGAGALADRRPAQLSGGQARRVAIARCLAADPVAVLLDEPLAAIDAPSAVELRHVLAARLRALGRPALLVTHDLLDLWRLADRVLVLQSGRVIEQGRVDEVLRRPRHEFLAHLGGRNLVAGRAVAADALRAGQMLVHGRADNVLPPGTETLALIDPAAVAVHLNRPDGSPRNVWQASVTGVEQRGDAARLTCDVHGHRMAVDLTMAAVAELGLMPGTPVWLSVKASQVLLYPR